MKEDLLDYYATVGMVNALRLLLNSASDAGLKVGLIIILLTPLSINVIPPEISD